MKIEVVKTNYFKKSCRRGVPIMIKFYQLTKCNYSHYILLMFDNNLYSIFTSPHNLVDTLHAFRDGEHNG